MTETATLTLTKGEIVRATPKLRFVLDAEGRRILQQEHIVINNGDTFFRWQDVPLVMSDDA